MFDFRNTPLFSFYFFIHCESYTISHTIIILLWIGATVEVLVGKSDDLQGIYFQDEEMKQIFRAYPELVCIDSTYKLLELRFPVYIMLVEDGNGQSEVVAVFFVIGGNTGVSVQDDEHFQEAQF